MEVSRAGFVFLGRTRLVSISALSFYQRLTNCKHFHGMPQFIYQGLLELQKENTWLKRLVSLGPTWTTLLAISAEAGPGRGPRHPDRTGSRLPRSAAQCAVSLGCRETSSRWLDTNRRHEAARRAAAAAYIARPGPTFDRPAPMSA